MQKIKFIAVFFRSYPALFYALFFLLGAGSYLYSAIFLYIFVFFIFLTILSLKNFKNIIFAILTFIFAIFYTSFFYSDVKKIQKPVQAKGIFKIDAIKDGNNFNSRYYIYKGELKTCKTKRKKYKNIPISIFSKSKLSANFLYKIDGLLVPKNDFSFYLKKYKIQKDKKIVSFVNLRYILKKKFQSLLKKSIFDKDAANFLYTLTTGENASSLLSYSFSKIGLQHVLAISGFHFSIFVLFFAFFLKLFIPKRYTYIILITIVTIYLLFVGPLISVQRAFIMIQMALIAPLINRRYFALNALGISMIIILLINPINISKIGFQLSFLSSFAILLAFPIIEKTLQKVITKRTYLEKQNLYPISFFADKLLTYLREALSLCFTVTIFILPVILYHFHKFSYLSFIYNLFIPFLVGIAILLVMLGFILHFTLPPIGFVINWINTYFTKLILKLITYPPASLEFYLRYKGISFEFVLIYLLIITILFAAIRYYFDKKNIPEYFYYL
ncbi:MAG: hypothetical protein KR126chlam6_01411 [Candidatus Anoxychlamydiales bacterium]|nr:hypothetical protein [Candidatus Anoxychlamydiales bacterium]